MNGNVARWRQLAAEARAKIETTKDPEARRILAEVATGYDRMIERAEKERADNDAQRQRFIEAAGEARASEDEAGFDENLKRVVTANPKADLKSDK
jgi:hypothetical protein